jgi:hypothetical protein
MQNSAGTQKNSGDENCVRLAKTHATKLDDSVLLNRLLTSVSARLKKQKTAPVQTLKAKKNPRSQATI